MTKFERVHPSFLPLKEVVCSSVRRPRSRARRMARVRLCTPNFERIWLTWSFTVPGVTTRAVAISWLEAPAANNCSTSSSRSLNGSSKACATEVWPGLPCTGLLALDVISLVGEAAIACSAVIFLPSAHLWAKICSPRRRCPCSMRRARPGRSTSGSVA